MRIIDDYRFVDTRDQGASVAIGNFDGVHKGHQSVIELARSKGAELSIPSAVLTFEPHPREFFYPSNPPFRLMSSISKSHQLQKLGVEILYQINFDSHLAAMSSDQFIDEILHQNLGIKIAVVGSDFQFGKDRKGTVSELAAKGNVLGFDVIVAPMLKDTGIQYSSSAIRKVLSEGKPAEAYELLGYWPRLEGYVVQGDQRGRKLGYPTANINLTGLLPPKMGIYSVQVDILSGPYKTTALNGVASIGVRPTFGENPLNLEVYLFDFDGDIYNEYISVAMIAFQRPEQRFSNADTLVQQMEIDIKKAQKNLAELIQVNSPTNIRQTTIE